MYQELRERPGARLTVGERGLLPELLAYAADGALNFADMGRLLRDAQDGAVQLVDEVRRRGLLAELARRPDGLSAKGGPRDPRRRVGGDWRRRPREGVNYGVSPAKRWPRAAATRLQRAPTAAALG